MKIGNFSVSIIIPTYNRAHLIRETLDSVVAQTYENWECIVVDDGSRDNTDEVVGEYVRNDKRFKYFERTENYLSGGNGARNFGLDLAQGEYIVFFDSDDLMTKNHLDVKCHLITSGDYDFGITRTKFFNYSNEKIDKFYSFQNFDINLDNYVLQNINWLTYDVIIKKQSINDIYFDESLKCAQEYNFYAKVLCYNYKSIYLDKIISLRRYSPRSISESTRKITNCKLLSHWKTFLSTKKNLSEETKKIIINRIFRKIVSIKEIPNEISLPKLFRFVLMHSSNRIYKLSYILIFRYSNKFHFLRKLALRDEN